MNISVRAPISKKSIAALVPFLLVSVSTSLAQHKITVDIETDTTIWAPVAYLSLIPDFNYLNTISYNHIIEQSGISKEGLYEFSTEYLPEEEHLYRVHFSKKGDPPASLILGGRDHNHFFLFAERNSNISVTVKSGNRFINDLIFQGYSPNKALQGINTMLEALDSIDQNGNIVNREYAIEAIYEDIKTYADTCSFPLPSLYALYNINYAKDYDNNPAFYRRYLHKWRSQKSLYFREFRSSIRGEIKPSWLIVIIAGSVMLSIILTMYLYSRLKKKNNKNPLSELTIQERKVFNLLKQGKSNKEIAEECSVSVSTIKSHVNSIYSKLDVRSRRDILDIEY
ncbi:MAG: helix-turn-helix transcriptional regulator [Bacteroidales bacterium]|nr:helix-turn-helix transcriptional regulator [Bacteroidales bacterium]